MNSLYILIWVICSISYIFNVSSHLLFSRQLLGWRGYGLEHLKRLVQLLVSTSLRLTNWLIFFSCCIFWDNLELIDWALTNNWTPTCFSPSVVSKIIMFFVSTYFLDSEILETSMLFLRCLLIPLLVSALQTIGYAIECFFNVGYCLIHTKLIP